MDAQRFGKRTAHALFPAKPTSHDSSNALIFKREQASGSPFEDAVYERDGITHRILKFPLTEWIVTHGIKWPRRPRYAVFGKFRNEFEGQLRCSFGFRRYDQLRAKLQDELMHLLAIPEFDQLAIGDTNEIRSPEAEHVRQTMLE